MTEPDVATQPPRPAFVRREYDWPGIKAMYVEGVATEADQEVRRWPSLAECAERFAVAHNRVREKSAEEGWREQRAVFQAHLEKVRQQRRVELMVKDATELDAGALKASKAGIQLAIARLGEIAAAQQQSNRLRSAGSSAADLERAVDARELDSLARAIDQFHRIGGRALGDVETTRHEVTGVGGGPLEVRQELTRDDPARLVGVFAVLQRAGVGDIFAAGALGGGAAALPAGVYPARADGEAHPAVP